MWLCHYLSRLLLLAIAGKVREFEKAFRAAMERFKDKSPMMQIQIISVMGRYYKAIRKPLPKDVMARHAELSNLFRTPPRIVLDNLPNR